MDELVTVLLSDGKPGHYHLAEGICAAIARRRPLAITRVEVRRPWWVPGRVLSAMTNLEGGAGQVPRLLGYGELPVEVCGLVVSAGGDTLAANVALARRYGCPNIFYGSLRRYQPADFALVLTSYAANAGRENHAMTLKPSAFDPDALPVRTLRASGEVTLGLLIGGDSGTVRYSAADWERLLGLLAGGAGAPNWIVSNSRRTPDAVSDGLAGLAAREPGRVSFIDVRAEGAAALSTLFASSDAVAVSVDSSSMVSEAVWARRPVVALVPEQGGLPELEQGYRDYLAAQGWVARIDLKGATAEAVVAAARGVRPIEANPLDQLGELIGARLPGLMKG